MLKFDNPIRRNEEIKRLRFEERLTLREISKKVGITHQAVSYILGKTGYIARNRTRMEVISRYNMTNQEVADDLGLCYGTVSHYRGKLRHKIEPDSTPGIGFYWERKISKKLSGLGIRNELQSFRSPFDILIDGRFRIDVKSSAYRADKAPSQSGSVSPCWGFSVNTRSSDFYIFVIQETEDCFIVPAGDLPKKSKTIRISWPLLGIKQNTKYSKFHEAWYLLR